MHRDRDRSKSNVQGGRETSIDKQNSFKSKKEKDSKESVLLNANANAQKKDKPKETLASNYLYEKNHLLATQKNTILLKGTSTSNDKSLKGLKTKISKNKLKDSDNETVNILNHVIPS